MAIVSLHIVVTGRVHGVGYRYYARELALGYGLSGWVKNVHDGSVELEVIGEKEMVDRYVNDLRNGPPNARVANLEITESPVEVVPVNTSFEIEFSS